MKLSAPALAIEESIEVKISFIVRDFSFSVFFFWVFLYDFVRVVIDR